MNETVNIVMLVKDRINLTTQTLSTLYKNTVPDMFNVTIIDDDSTSGKRWEALAANMTVLTIRNSKGITGQARNLGVYWAERYWGRAQWLYLSDNDVYFTPGWLDKLVGVMLAAEDYGFRIMGGWNHPFLRPREGFSTTYNGKTVHEYDALTGASQLMRWDMWDKYGPLDAHAKGVSQSEDWKFCRDIAKDGGKIGAVHQRLVWNTGLTDTYGKAATGADVVLKELEEARKKYPDLYWG